MVREKAEVTGSGKGPNGWFKLTEAKVSFEHPFNLQSEYALNLDFVNDGMGLDARVAVELSPESARRLMEAIGSALTRGEEVLGSEFVVALR
jgi:hypothetical protein